MPRTSRFARAALAILFSLHGTSNAGFAQATFQALGGMPGSPSPMSAAMAVSSDGLTVGGFARTSSGPIGREAAIFPYQTAMGLGNLPSLNTWGEVRALSADGQTAVGNSSRVNDLNAFRWTSAGGMTSLGMLPGAFSSGARGLSDDGSVVVGLSTFREETSSGPSITKEATVWVNGQAQGLGLLLGGVESEALAVSADGTVIVGRANVPGILNGNLAFIWRASTGIVALPDLPAGYDDGAAVAVSSDGNIVAGWGNPSYHPAKWRIQRWTGGVRENLGSLPGHFHAIPHDMTPDGSVIVGWSSELPGLDRTPVIWDAANGMRDLVEVLESAGIDFSAWRNYAGRVWMEATAISHDGKTIVGHGRMGNYQTGWIATLP
jgi:uncharacterized membrane protein